VCGSGAEQGFSYSLGPGERIRIGQTENSFDSKHVLRYGGSYPGDNEVRCVDGYDTNEYLEFEDLVYTNTGTVSAVAVYFVVDAYGSDEAGDFVLAWNVESMAYPVCFFEFGVWAGTNLTTTTHVYF
jgi:hypothetical protein